jgi:hypothetical protein
VEALTAEDVGDRDARTVFVTNLPTKADEKDIRNFFGKAGKVRDVRLITDRFSRKSKGYGSISHLHFQLPASSFQHPASSIQHPAAVGTIQSVGRIILIVV